jgi:hypothetical protein
MEIGEMTSETRLELPDPPGFTCPVCSNRTLIEIEYSPVALLQYGGFRPRFKCERCGYIVDHLSGESELKTWIRLYTIRKFFKSFSDQDIETGRIQGA